MTIFAKCRFFDDRNINADILNRHIDSLQFCPAHQCYQRVPRPHANQYKVNMTK